MATPVISHPTAVDSSPLLTIGDEKPDKDVRLGQATKLSTALSEATADQQDTSDSDNELLEGEKKLEVQADKNDTDDDEALQGEKDVEVQADTQDKPQPRPRPQPILVPRPQPQPAPVAGPDAGPNGTEPLAPPKPRPPASTQHGTGSTKTNGTDAKKQQKGASAAASSRADAGSETAAADAGAHDKPRLPYRRNENGPRKGGKQKEKGALGRALEKLKMGLFSKKKKEPVVENPYAAPLTPYEQARNELHQQKVGGAGSPGGLPSNPRMNSFASSTATAPPPYQSPAMASDGGRFGDEKYGNQNGYGKNRYDNDNATAFSANQNRPGGYGGFGDDAGSNGLFGGASGRYVPPQQGANGSPSMRSPSNGSPSMRYDNDPSKSTLLGGAQDRYNPLPPTSRQDGPAGDDEYGGYGAPRELTEEERDKEEARATNAQARAIRKEGVDSVNRSLAAMEQALGHAASSTARLGEQDNRLANAERNVDRARVMTRTAEKSTKELDHINSSMFSGLIGPSKRKISRQDAETLAEYKDEKEQASRTAKDRYLSDRQIADTYNDLDENKPRLLGAGRSTVDKSKFLYEDSDDDEEEKQLREQDAADEDHINDGVDRLLAGTRRLKGAAIGMGGTLETQNQRLDRLAEKTDAVDDRVRMNREKLSRIR